MTITASKVMELRAATGAGMMDCKKALEETSGDMEAARDYLRKKGIAIAQKKAGRETNEGAVAIRLDDGAKQGSIVQLACETDFVARNEQFTELMEQLTRQALAKGGDDLTGQQSIAGSGTVAELITEGISKLGENLQFLAADRLAVSGEGVVGGYVHSNNKIGVLVSLGSDKAVDSARLSELAKDISMHIAASNVNAVSEEDIDPKAVEKEKDILVAQAKESGKPDDIIEKMVQGKLKKFVAEITLLNQPFVKDPEKTIQALLDENGKQLGASLKVEKFVKLQF
ncbi:MAG: translation elongation factor Ts [Deltaproteobacteria bacterium]|nr:translation elongation factor Ts [Deltaproteobacteria bacterium]